MKCKILAPALLFVGLCASVTLLASNFSESGRIVNKESAAFRGQRMKMVKEQIASRGIKNRRVLKAMREVKRHTFVPYGIQWLAYRDSPLPIGEGQTISQPFIVAYMTEALELKPQDKVLEIGTGSGYQAAVLAKLVKHVYSIEIVESLGKNAEMHLKDQGYTNVTIKIGDGYQGWKEHAPFDHIIVTAAPKHVPQPLIDQLKVGGTMIMPVGGLWQELIRITKTKKGFTKEKLIPVRFVPMVGEAEEDKSN